MKALLNLMQLFSLIFFSFRSDTSESCYINRACDCNRKDFGYTIFSKVALNISSLRLISKQLFKIFFVRLRAVVYFILSKFTIFKSNTYKDLLKHSSCFEIQIDNFHKSDTLKNILGLRLNIHMQKFSRCQSLIFLNI